MCTCTAGCLQVVKGFMSTSECIIASFWYIYSSVSFFVFLLIVTDTEKLSLKCNLTTWADWKPSHPLIPLSIFTFTLRHVCKRINMVPWHTLVCCVDAPVDYRVEMMPHTQSFCNVTKSLTAGLTLSCAPFKCAYCANQPFSPVMPLWHLTLFAIEGFFFLCSKGFWFMLQ